MSMDTVHYPSIDAKRDELGVTKQAVADRLDLSWEQAKKKLAGEVEFNITEVRTLADWWGVCIDELIGREIPRCPIYRPTFVEREAS